jgi:hypothetical protein
VVTTFKRDQYPSSRLYGAFALDMSTSKTTDAFDIANYMAKGERIKEEIGWLKVVFAIVAAVDASLIAWVVQNLNTERTAIMAAAFFLALLFSAIVIHVNHLAFERIKELEQA